MKHTGESAGRLRLWAALLALPLRVFAGDGPLSPAHYDVETFDTDLVEAAVSHRQVVELSFFGSSHRLVLEPSDVRSPRFIERAGSLLETRPVHSAPARSYKGHVEGDANSVVRLTNTPSGLRGYVKSSEGWAFFEPLVPPGAQALRLDGSRLAHKVFTEADIDASFLGHCAEPVQIESAGETSAPSPRQGVRSSEATANAADLRVFELAIDADAEFFGIYGSNSTTEIETIINMVDGIYEAELGLTIELVSVHVWEAEPDPFTSTDSGTLLGELRSYWNTNNGSISRDAAHLFTGKELDGSTVGIAYVSVVCSTSVAYGLSQDLSSDTLMPLLVAHEIGHNLGANHDASGSSPRYIMYPSLGFTNLDEFSAGSKQEVADYVAGVSCLEAQGGGSNISNPPGSGGHHGGGGGPADPALIVLLAAAGCLKRWKQKA